MQIKYLETFLWNGSTRMVVLWLDGARMNAKVVQHIPDFYGHRHEVVISRGQNMNRGHQFVFRELPDM